MWISLDVETSKLPYAFPWQPEAYLSTIGIVVQSITLDGFCSSTEHFYVVNHNEQTSFDDPRIIQPSLHRSNTLVGANLKFDLCWLLHSGINFDEVRLFDIQVAEYLLEGQQPEGLKLNYLAQKYLGREKLPDVAEYWEQGLDTKEIPLDKLREYNLEDCRLTLEIAKIQEKLLKEKGLWKVALVDFEKIKTLTDMEYEGVKVDTRECDRLGEELRSRISLVERDLREHCKRNVNLDSPEQLSSILYGGCYKVPESRVWVPVRLKSGQLKWRGRAAKLEVKEKGLGIEPIKGSELKKPGLYSASVPILQQLRGSTATQKAVLGLLNERSAIAQQLETFVDGIRKHIIQERVHPSFNGTVTRTGRLSCSNPNLQNQSRESTFPIRKIFQSTRGQLVACDLSQLEWQVAALLSQDKVMLDEIHAGVDAHAATGKDVFDGKGERVAWKIFNFRMIYGGSAYSYYADYKMPNFSLSRWEKIVDRFYEKYHGLHTYHDGLLLDVMRNGGWHRSPTGRLYKFTKTPTQHGLDYRKPQIYNYPVQGTATGDFVPLFMDVCRARARTGFPNSKLVLQVHDEIIFDCPNKDVDGIANLLYTIVYGLPSLIEQTYKFKCNVPLGGKVKAGTNWLEMKELPR